MNSRIEEYLDALRKHLGSMARDERDAVIAEVQDHLEAESARLQSESSGMSDDVAAARAIDAFGPAGEIGVAYGGSEETVRLINQETGEKLLEGIQVAGRVAGKVAVVGGRGLKGVLKFAGIGVLAVLAVATILTVAALLTAGTLATAYKDEITESIPRPLYSYGASWGASAPETRNFTESFEVREGMKEFWIDIDLWGDSGCGTVRLLNPSGTVVYDSGSVCGDRTASGQRNFATQGIWTVEYTFVAYDGHVNVEAMYFEESSG